MTRAGNRRLALAATRPLRAFIYNRVSRDPQRRETSIRDQSIENHRTCEENGWTVAAEFKDPDRSASRHRKRERPEWEEMLRKVRAGECDVIVFWEPARAYRDLVVFVELRALCLELGILLCYDGEVFDVAKPQDWKRLTRDALEAEEDAERIRNRLLRTTRLSAERGAIHGKIPFGFRRVYDSATGRLVAQVEDEERSAVVLEAAQRVAANETTYAIANDFQARGIRPPRDADRGWAPQTINQIVLNPAVAGLRVHQGVVVGKAVWDAILDEDLYSTCKLILLDPARRKMRDSAVQHLLSGIAVCYCGGVLRVRHNRKQLTYQCVAKFCCSMERVKFELYVQNVFLTRAEKPSFRRALQSDARADAASKARLLAEELEAELAQARLLVGERKLSVMSLASLEQQLLPKIDAARLAADGSRFAPVLWDLAVPDARAVWARFELPQKRAALRAACTITLNRARVAGVRSIEPGRVTFDWLV